MKFGFLTLTTLMVSLAIAQPAAAFSKEAVNRHSFVSADGQTGVYTLQIMLGGFSKDMYVPVVGERDIAHGTRGNTFGFTMEAGAPTGVSTDGQATSLLVAPLEIEDGMYRVPAGTFAPITFFTVFTVDEDESSIYRYRINEFPFYIGDDRSPRHFSTGELKYMVTNYESVNFTPDPE